MSGMDRHLSPAARHRILAAVCALVVGLLGALLGPRTPHLSADATGDQELAARVRALLPDDAGFRSLHVTLITPEGVTHAGLGSTDGLVPGADTRFDLASITKLFTAQLLFDSIARGEVKLGDEVSKHLPELAGSEAGTLTLDELSRHQGGIPSEPFDGPEGEYRFLLWPDCGHRSLTEFLDTAAMVQLAGRGAYAYSNEGVVLLGLALTRAAQYDSWEQLTAERLLRPLGMDHTSFASTTLAELPEQRLRGGLDNGHRLAPLLDPVEVLAGGGTWTTAADMATFAQAVISGDVPGRQGPLLAPASGESPAGSLVKHLWEMRSLGGAQVYGHGGMHLYSVTQLLIDPVAGRGVIVVANTTKDITGLAEALFTEAADPLPRPRGWSDNPAQLLPYGGVFAFFVVWSSWRWAKLRSRLAIVIRAVDLASWAAITAALGPWALLPGWLWALCAGMAAYAVVRSLQHWPGVSSLPPCRRWYFGLRLPLCLAWAALAALLLLPKWG